MRRVYFLLMAILLGCSAHHNERITCPDGHIATIEKCEPAQLVSRRVVLAADVNLEYAGQKLADVDVGLATDVERLAATLTNRTVQLQSVLHSLCQQRNTSPCNESFQERLTAAIERVNKDILTIKEQTDEIKILTDKAVTASDAAQRSEALDKTGQIVKQASDKIDETVSSLNQSTNPPSN